MDTQLGEFFLYGAATLVSIVSFVIGRRWGYRVLVDCLSAEGYVVTMDPTKAHGDGRFAISTAKEPPF